jgi:ATP-dependent helicase HrpB
MNLKTPLPIDPLIPQITDAIAAGRDVILKASPGSGKTTRVPPALMGVVPGQIWVLEPRRLAARMSAIRVADELGERAGATVGWQMRFDNNVSAKSRVIFLTEGMFTALFAQNPSLEGVSCVVLDEFHERHQQTDVAFALLEQLRQTQRPDLRLIVMSATLDTGLLKDALSQAALIDLEIPLHPVKIEHWEQQSHLNIVERTVEGVERAVTDTSHRGHVLAFLPGTSEILRTRIMLQNRLPAAEWLVLELRGSLDKATQDLAFKETAQRKIILATNIAESSITIPGVTAVIDSGMARVASYNPFTGMSSLETKPVAKSSLIQRAGRAGRTAPGMALRLFSKQDEAARPDVDTPEVLRLDLAPIYLSLLWISSKIGEAWRPEDLPWLARPDTKAWTDARQLLCLLGFTDQSGHLLDTRTPLLPVHPRVAKFASTLIAERYTDETPWLTAILASPDDAPSPTGDLTGLGCDLLARYEALRAMRNPSGTVTRAAQQIARILKIKNFKELQECRPAHELDPTKALLSAFPDRVMQIRPKTAKANWIEATLCTGGDLRLAKESAAAHGEWVIALDATSTRVTGSLAALTNSPASTSSQVTVTMASQITLADLSASPLLATEDIREWDERAGKSRLVRKTKYGVLALSSQFISEDIGSADSPSVSDSASHLLQQLKKSWPKPFDDGEEFESYLIRQKLAYDAKLTDHIWDRTELFELLLAHICDEAKSFTEVAARPLGEWLRHCVGEDEFSRLLKITPLTITVGAGHKVKVHYSASSPPWIEARLQNFFGQAQTPKILDGRLPLTVHLLAPNMRALQVTTDLAGFWQRVYPSLRNEYQRKYPRHAWPENPLTAEPPPPKPPRRPSSR